MNTPLLEIKDLHTSYKVYAGFLRVLDGIYIKVDKGSKVGLVGETGCGKTTTMKSIMRILPPNGRINGGEILFKGVDILKMRSKKLQQLRRIGISAIFQDPTAALNPVFTVGEQLRDAIKYSSKHDGSKLSKQEIDSRAIGVLEDTQMPDPERLLNNYPVQLSGGMKQRVCIALALVSSSELLIADEPGTNLDVTIQDQILRLLMKLVEERETGIIYITHTLGVVMEWTEYVCVMYAGNIVEMAKTDVLFSSPLHPYTQGLIEAVPKLTGEGIAEGIQGRVPEYIKPPSGCRFNPRCEHKMDKCEREKPLFFKVNKEHKVACFLYEDGENE